VRTHRRMIWVTIFALMIIGHQSGRLDFLGFVILWIIGGSLVRMFATAAPAPPIEEPADQPDDDAPDPADVIRIRRRHVEMLRNSLMRHHSWRGTDKAYQASAAAKETTEILQQLNASLAKKIRHSS
jgi:hypothetical protein